MGKMQFLIFLGYSFSEITILQKANPTNNSSAVIRLIISKSTHHPTNKSLFNLPRGIKLEAIPIYPIPTFLQRGGTTSTTPSSYNLIFDRMIFQTLIILSCVNIDCIVYLLNILSWLFARQLSKLFQFFLLILLGQIEKS